MKLLNQNLTQTEIINDVGIKTQHIFDQESINAINAALAIKRPLLIWGEPGIGKSQLAKAVAKELGRVYIPFVVNAHTESHDLLWQFDAVARLAEAQIQNPNSPNLKALAMENFIVPQALWWGLNWESADKLLKTEEGSYRHQPPVYNEKKCDPEKNGVVVLIDEIDKTDADVPNGLLEALGAGRFHPQGLEHAVEAKGETPLIIITTNDEQSLPDAFVRRCLSLHLKFPNNEEAQREFLTERGRINFPQLDKTVKTEQNKEQNLLTLAANLLIEDRQYADENHLYPLCGQAEYFDLLRGIDELNKQGRGSHEELVHMLRRYTFQKHPQFNHPD